MGGGGRYDGLIGMFLGREVPACGLSLGLERILVVMAERNMYPETLGGPDALLAATSEARFDAALQLAQALREAGLKIDLVPRALAPGKLRKQADEEGVAAAIWIEEDPARGQSVWSRASGETQHGVAIESIASLLRK
jgi:histidyl-tRNA synthetase